MSLTRRVRGDSRFLRRRTLFLAAAALVMWAPPTNAAPAPPQFSVLPSAAFDVSTTDPRGRWIGSPFIPTERFARTTLRRAVTSGSDDRPYATLSGTLIKGAAATTTWALYPGACVEISQGVWAPKTYPVADSLQPTPGFPYSDGYTVGQPAGGVNTIGYTRVDQSALETLWHVVSGDEPANQRPAIISGQRMLWCGKYDAGWLVPVGYPNNTSQVLYIDTGAHAAPYYLLFEGNISCEVGFDRVRIIGGGDGERDPLGNQRECFGYNQPPGENCSVSHSKQLVEFTGDFVGGDFPALGQTEGRMEGPATGHYRIGPIDAEHRAIYIFFWSDDLYSTADGVWGQSQGILLDNIDTSDNGAIYTDQAPVGGVDEYGGQIVLGTPASPVISCRVFPGVGSFWSLVSGDATPTEDSCSPQKAASDLLFHDGDPVTHLAVARMRDEIHTCSIPVPPGTARIIASWDSYGGTGCDLVFSALASWFKDGRWHGPWWAGYAGGATWNHWSDEILLPAEIDSVRLHFRFDCGLQSAPALLIDNVGLQFVSGVPPRGPVIDYAYGPRSTFIDGTIRGAYCGQPPCWPSVTEPDDNWNNENGYDEVRILLSSALRGFSGNGINWRTAGADFAHPRSGYNPAYDVPRLIYRLFDPATLGWSPWDSTEIQGTPIVVDADGGGPAPSDTTDVRFSIDWPPPDKIVSGALLPGGFTINGVASYADLSWLPRGTRMQYYWKAVDINGGVTYSFHSYWMPQWSTVDDGEYPNLPCHDAPGCVGPKAPEINEWRVLPGVYPPGPSGSLLAGRTNTPILVLDDRYGPVAQALRGLGVRADRHPSLELGGHVPGGDGGGDAWPGYENYPIVDSLAAWYRIVIVPMSRATDFEGVLFGHNMTAHELRQWLETDTGPDGGDRCLFVDGDDALSALLASGRSTQVNLVQEVLGVTSATASWFGAVTTPYPNLDDRFSAPIGGAGLAAPGTYAYPVDGGCSPTDRSGLWWGDYFSPPRFDALTRALDANTQAVVSYPNGQVAGVARMRELDATADRDRQKTLAHGFSMEHVADPGSPPGSPNYEGTGLSQRAQMLYKFLTSCRGSRTSAPSDTGTCWPCPTPGAVTSLMGSDWSGLSAGFQTSTYGPLYPIQAGQIASGIFATDVPASAPKANRIDGNYPNPFNPRTTLRFSSASAGWAEIRIFGISGRLVRVVRAMVKAGPNELPWEARGLASGVYYYKIQFPDARSLVAPNHLVIVK